METIFSQKVKKLGKK